MRRLLHRPEAWFAGALRDLGISGIPAFGSLVGLLVAGYLGSVLTLTLVRSSAVQDAAGVEGSQASGTSSHLATWLVLLLVGALYGLLLDRRRAVTVSILFGCLVALLASLWEFDALSSPAVTVPRKHLAWVFLLGAACAPPLGAALLVRLRRLKRPRPASSG
jgi:hypothetical protein